MNRNQLVEALYQLGAIQFGDFTLKSGLHSKIYLDLRRIISIPNVLRSISELIWQKVENCQFDLICGVPYTALPIATCISLDHNIPMIMRRKEKKAYGTKQQIEGIFAQDETCLIIEDLITTGSSILETVEDLNAHQIKVHDVAMLIDRGKDGKNNLKNKNLNVHAVFTLKEILTSLVESVLISAEEKIIIQSLLDDQP